mmetsp:Transcript_51909/g.166179  ORF Transcript_51909/g.166179 Transcript_51909/m.166179 type:complete len:234 (-) Transcript_51909:809-1510(-)
MDVRLEAPEDLVEVRGLLRDAVRGGVEVADRLPLLRVVHVLEVAELDRELGAREVLFQRLDVALARLLEVNELDETRDDAMDVQRGLDLLHQLRNEGEAMGHATAPWVQLRLQGIERARAEHQGRRKVQGQGRLQLLVLPDPRDVDQVHVPGWMEGLRGSQHIEAAIVTGGPGGAYRLELVVHLAGADGLAGALLQCLAWAVRNEAAGARGVGLCSVHEFRALAVGGEVVDEG